MELAGKIIAVLEARSGIAKSSGNSWKIQEYVLETVEQYPHRMIFNVFGEDKINQFNIQLGDEINVSFDVNAREYNGRWYNDIRAWKVDRVTPDQQQTQEDQTSNITSAPVPINQSFQSSEPTDDLPF